MEQLLRLSPSTCSALKIHRKSRIPTTNPFSSPTAIWVLDSPARVELYAQCIWSKCIIKQLQTTIVKHMGVSKNSSFPSKSSILIGFSIIFTIYFGVPLFLETPICMFVEHLLDVESIYIRYLAFPPMKKLVMSLGFAYRSSLHIKSDTAHRIIRVLSQPSSFKDHKTITGTTVWSKVSYVLSCSITSFALHEI